MSASVDSLAQSHAGEDATTMPSFRGEAAVDGQEEKEMAVLDGDGHASSHNTPPATDAETPAAPKPAGPPGPPFSVPDGGVRAWLQVLGGFMLFFNTWYVMMKYMR
jgi:hypothetical protein